jgi:hypothetical protein
MDWIIENWDQILTVVGGFYVGLRTIIALTPTTKDDEILSNVNGKMKKIIIIIGKIAGLDITQGMKS